MFVLEQIGRLMRIMGQHGSTPVSCKKPWDHKGRMALVTLCSHKVAIHSLNFASLSLIEIRFSIRLSPASTLAVSRIFKTPKPLVNENMI